MEINTMLDIKPRDRELLFSLLSQYLPDTKIWAYGSRVTGDAKPWSDLDLVVFPKANAKRKISLLQEALDESNLSFRVDLFEWEMLPDNFKENIKASHTVLVR